jgi:hypothetical protein
MLFVIIIAKHENFLNQKRNNKILIFLQFPCIKKTKNMLCFKFYDDNQICVVAVESKQKICQIHRLVDFKF